MEYTYSTPKVASPSVAVEGPLKELSQPLQDIATATLLAHGASRTWWKSRERARALESVLAAFGSKIITASAFNPSTYRSKRRHAHGDGLGGFGRLVSTGEYGLVTMTAASSALDGPDQILCLRAVCTALLVFFTPETTVKILSTILPHTLTQNLPSSNLDQSYDGAALAALRRYVSEVEAEEQIDPIRKTMLDSTMASVRQLFQIDFVSFNELQGGTEDFANVAGLLLWLLQPRTSRNRQVYPTSSLTTWALSFALSTLGFEVTARYQLINTQQKYSDAFERKADPQIPQVYLVMGAFGQTDTLRPATKKPWCKPHSVFTSVRNLPMHIFKSEKKPYIHELLCILFEDVFQYVRQTLDEGKNLPVNPAELGKTDKRLQTLMEKSAAFIQSFYTMSRRRPSFVEGVIRDLSLAWLDWIESTDKKSKRHSNGSDLFKRKPLIVGAALDAFEADPELQLESTQFQGLGYSPFDIAEAAIFGAAYGLLSKSITYNGEESPNARDLNVAFFHKGWYAHYNLTNFVGEPPEKDGIRECRFGLDIFETLDWLLQRRIISQLTERMRRISNGPFSPGGGPNGRSSPTHPDDRFGRPIEREQREFKLIHSMLTGSTYPLDPTTPPPHGLYTCGITLLKTHLLNPTIRQSPTPYHIFTGIPLDLPLLPDGTLPIAPPSQTLQRPFSIPLNNHIQNAPITLKPTDTPLSLTFTPDWDSELTTIPLDDPSSHTPSSSTPPIIAKLSTPSSHPQPLPPLSLTHFLHPHFRQLWTHAPTHSTRIPCTCHTNGHPGPLKTSPQPRLWRELPLSELLSHKSLHMQLRANVGRPFWLVVQAGGCEVGQTLAVLAAARSLFEWRKMRGPGYKGFGVPPGGGPPGAPPVRELEDLVFVECWRCFDEKVGTQPVGGMKIIISV